MTRWRWLVVFVTGIALFATTGCHGKPHPKPRFNSNNNWGWGTKKPAPRLGKAQTCKASYYGGPEDHSVNSHTASRERFNWRDMTAAHNTLKFGTKVKVTNPKNKKSVTVRINDRGPGAGGRCIDLTKGAFQKIASTKHGLITVKIQVYR